MEREKTFLSHYYPKDKADDIRNHWLKVIRDPSILFVLREYSLMGIGKRYSCRMHLPVYDPVGDQIILFIVAYYDIDHEQQWQIASAGDYVRKFFPVAQLAHFRPEIQAIFDRF